MELSKQYYSISEVAAIFKVNTSKIRYWALNFKGKEKNPHQNVINQLTDIRDFLQGMKADLDME